MSHIILFIWILLNIWWIMPGVESISPGIGYFLTTSTPFARRTSKFDGLGSNLEKYYLPKDSSSPGGDQTKEERSIFGSHGPTRASRSEWYDHFPKFRLRCDPLINLSLKQRLNLLGARVTLGFDYHTDIHEWRSYWSVEDSLLRGRFTLRGSEIGWAKAWMIPLGLGEASTAKIKLRLGLNLKTQRLYAKLRFRTDPVSPVDIRNGLSCAGRIPVTILPNITRSLPLRIEYLLRITTSREPRHLFERTLRSTSSAATNNVNLPLVPRRWRHDPAQGVSLSTGLGVVDVSLDELNFVLEWEESKPVWGIGLVRNEPSRKKLNPPPHLLPRQSRRSTVSSKLGMDKES